ncbi:hypothetical protein ACROYT_G020124 [Oculina patagonica]
MSLFTCHTSQVRALFLLFIYTIPKHAGTQASGAGCSTPELGMAKGAIPDSDITASSALNADSSAFHARLGNTKAWIPSSNDKNPWIQVNLKYTRNITAVATQGFQGSFIRWYYLSYGDDGRNWKNYTVQGTIKKFEANVDDTGSKTVVFNPSVKAQYIRLHTTNCSNQCALQFELYGCNLTTGLPGQPSIPTADSISTHEITISWTAPSKVGDGITGYNVQWQVVGKLTKDQKVVTGSTSARLVVTPYTEYDIQVRAYNGKGDGPWSAPLKVRSKESVPSAAPGNFKLDSSSSLSLDVSWDAIPAEQQQGVLLGYHVYYKIQGNATELKKSVEPKQLTYKLTGLEYKNYVVRVAGFTAVGDGKSTAPETKIPNEGAPTPPRNLKLTVETSKAIRASWQVPLKFNGIFRRYVVMYGESRDKLDQRFYPTSTSYLLHPLEEYTEYFVQVYAETAVSGAASNIEQATTLEDAPSSSPAINKQETKAEDAHTILVKWHEINKKDQNGIILGYYVYYNEKDDLDTKSQQATATNTIIRGLKPYKDYCIKVKGYTSVGASPEEKCFFVTTLESGPSHPRNVEVRATSSVSIHVKWKEPERPNGNIKEYIISFGTSKDYQPNERTVTAGTRERVLDGLNKFTTYFIKVRGKTSEIGNASQILNATTYEDSPGPPVQFTGQVISDMDIHLSWKDPLNSNGIVRFYYIRIYDTKTGQQVQNIVNKTAIKSDRPQWQLISNLKPFTNYTFTVQAVTIKPGEMANVTARTDEGVPSQPRDVTATLVNDAIVVTWKEPEDRNGILSSYKVYCEGRRDFNSSFKVETQVVEGVSSRRTVIKKGVLKPGTKYSVYVKATTVRGDGARSSPVVVQTPSQAPPPPLPPRVVKDDVTPTTITISLTPSSDSNGKIIFHQVIVELVGKVSKREVVSLPDDIFGYKEAQANGDRFYIAAQFDRGKLPDEFILGNGKTYGGYENAPLEPETEYKAYLRGVTEHNGKWLLGEPAAISLPPTGEEPTPKNQDNIVGVVAGILGALILIVIIIIAVLLYKRSNRPPNANLDVENQKRKRREFELKRSSVRKKLLAAPGEVTNDADHPPIPVEQFGKHVTKMHKSDDRGFMIEYNKLDSGQEYASDAALLQENKAKNRYGNIIAYDHSRVVLSPIDGMDGSDYINATRVDGYNKPNAYIASQGPVPPTFDDFWRMVWEQQSASIVMLTNLQERHKLKCHKYWPDETHDYGDISVMLVKSEHYSDYKIRTFNVKRESEKEEREVKQFHFTVWPDHGVPEYPTALLAFRRRIRAYNPADAGPLVVHCSAGVGRTGTFMVIDSMLDRIKAESTIDIYNFVAYLRTRRTAMVQTEEQYTFCHDAILESVQCGNTQIYAHDLRITLSRMSDVAKDAKVTRFESEFKTLNKVSPVLHKGHCVVASYPENKEKNRSQEILAPDCYRVILTAIDDNESTSYINAVHISGYKQQHAFIVTQHPLTPTVTDFWRMLCEQECSCVVLFDSNEEEGDFPLFWPGCDTETYDDMITVQRLTVNSSSVDNLKANYDQSEITEKTFRATDLRTPEKSLRVKMFQYSGWMNENDAPKGSGLITLIAKVEKWQQHSGNGPITVICSDGLGRSGTFCALYSVLERLKIEQVIDVFQAIKAMRIPRPGLVKTAAEYKFIHYAIQDYLSAFDDYANFKP